MEGKYFPSMALASDLLLAYFYKPFSVGKCVNDLKLAHTNCMAICERFENELGNMH